MSEIRHRTHRKTSSLRVLLRHYQFEIIWLAVIVLGVFLVFERLNIRRNVLQWVRMAAGAALRGFGRLDEVVSGFLARTTVSDAIGYVLIVGALGAILLRMRWRLMNNSRMTAVQCPKCASEIHRVHRTRFDHLVDVFVPVRRYRCASRACGWKGLRIVERKGLLSSRPTPSAD